MAEIPNTLLRRMTALEKNEVTLEVPMMREPTKTIQVAQNDKCCWQWKWYWLKVENGTTLDWWEQSTEVFLEDNDDDSFADIKSVRGGLPVRVLDRW